MYLEDSKDVPELPGAPLAEHADYIIDLHVN